MPRWKTVVASAVLLVPFFAFAGEPTVRRETQFPVEVRHTISASSAKIGDTVEFRTDEPVLIGNNIVVPEKATILGTVVDVRRHTGSFPSVLRIRFDRLRWKSGEAKLNAMVLSVRRLYAEAGDWRFHYAPTFIEGIRVISHQQRDAYTEFICDKKDVTLRSGVAFMLRQIDPDSYPAREFMVYSPKNELTARSW